MTSERVSTTTPAVRNANPQLRLPPQRRKAAVAAARSSESPASLRRFLNGSSRLRPLRLLAPREVLTHTLTKNVVPLKPTIVANAPRMKETEAIRRTKTGMTGAVALVVVVAVGGERDSPMADSAPSEPEPRRHAPSLPHGPLKQDVIVAPAHAANLNVDLPREIASPIAAPLPEDATLVPLNNKPPQNPVAGGVTVAASVARPVSDIPKSWKTLRFPSAISRAIWS